MIRFPRQDDRPVTPFSSAEVSDGIKCSACDGDGPGRVLVTVDNKPDVFAFYGAEPESSCDDPAIFLRGDVVKRSIENYTAITARCIQVEAERTCANFARTFVHLARRGISGSTGFHRNRRQLHEVELAGLQRGSQGRVEEFLTISVARLISAEDGSRNRGSIFKFMH